MRVARHDVASLLSHTQEVCGLSWSPNGTHLASGGNDNFLNIWDVNLQSSGEINSPVHSLADHKAAVKVNCVACFITQISLTFLWFVSLLLFSSTTSTSSDGKTESVDMRCIGKYI